MSLLNKKKQPEQPIKQDEVRESEFKKPLVAKALFNLFRQNKNMIWVNFLTINRQQKLLLVTIKNYKVKIMGKEYRVFPKSIWLTKKKQPIITIKQWKDEAEHSDESVGMSAEAEKMVIAEAENTGDVKTMKTLLLVMVVMQVVLIAIQFIF